MPAAPSPTRRVDGSMSLLVDLMQHAEDPAYAAAARPAGDPAAVAPPGGRRGRALSGALVLALAGVLTGAAGSAVRDAAGGDGRQELAERVQERTAASDALLREAAVLRADVDARRDAALGGGQEAARLEQLELAAAASPVTGPGVVVVLDDRPEDAPGGPPPARGGQSPDGRVLDRDLQDLVNGLWAAGAEAVSVNDLRLTSRTAIRAAGEAVLVDFRPLSPPYVVRAIGDPGRLEPAFVDGPVGRRLVTYTSLYGLRLEVRTEDALRLPAGTVPRPRAATAAPGS